MSFKEIAYGKDTMILVNKLGDGNYLPVLCSRTCTVSFTADMIETSDITSGNFKEFEPTMMSGTMSGDGIATVDGNMTIFDINNFYLNRQKFGVSFFLLNNNGTKRYIMATAFVTSLQLTAGHNDVTNYSYQLQLSGILTVQTSLAGGGGGSASTANDEELIYFTGVPNVSISWTLSRKNRFGIMPEVQVWFMGADSVYYLTSVQPTLDAAPPSFTTMSFDFGANSTGFIVLK